MSRYFSHRLVDCQGLPAAPAMRHDAIVSMGRAVRYALSAEDEEGDFTLYTGLAGIVHLCWRARALAVRDSDVAAELSAEELSQVAQTLTAAALASAGRTPRRHHGWSLPLGHAGAYCMAALSYHEAAKAAELAGGETTAAALRRSSQESAKHYSELSSLAASAAEDEFLYGRAGWLFGGLLLNKHLGIGAVPEAMLRHVVETVLQSGRRAASSCGQPTPLYYYWHSKPFLGAAHGMLGILYVLMHFPQLFATTGHMAEDLQGGLRYILSLECDAHGVPGPHGHYPTQMGAVCDRDPLVHWCHGAAGAVFTFCKAYEVFGSTGYLAAAQRSGEAVWQRGLLKKGPGLCHGVSGSTYALLRLYKSTQEDIWLQRAWQFALFTNSDEFRRGARVPDHPHSLFEGWAGAACLWADLLDPKNAAFPMYEL